MTVQVRVIFLKIGEIDTVHENFAADVFIQTKWKEPALNGHIDVVSIHSSISKVYSYWIKLMTVC